MPAQPADSEPPSTPDLAPGLEGVNIESLLEQAAQLTQAAVHEVGAVPKRDQAARPPLDPEHPADAGALVDQQLAEIQSLVEQANVESGALAETDVATINDLVAHALRTTPVSPPTRPPPAAKPASSTARPEQPSAQSPTARDGDEGPPDSTTNRGLPQVDDASSPEQSSVDAGGTSVASALASSHDQQPKADPSRLAALLSIPHTILSILNWPFARMSDPHRELAGLLGIVTAVAAAAAWLLPTLMKR